MSERDELPSAEPQRLPEPLGVNRAPEHRGKVFRRAEQIDVLADEAGIDRCVQAAFLGRNILHPLAMGHVDEIERRGADEVLGAGLAANIDVEALLQPVLLRVRPATLSRIAQLS